MDTDSFIIHIKTKDFYKDIANDVEKWFDTYNYGEDDKRPSPIGKNKKVIGLFTDELGGKIMIEFVRLWAKTYPFLMDDKWPYIPDRPYRILIIGGSGFGNKCIIKFNKQPARYW